MTLGIGAGGAAVLGSVGRFEAKRLVEALVKVLPYFASSGIGASASVLALMLTLLGMSRQADVQLAETFYRRILWIGRQASALFVGNVILLLTLAAPVGVAEAESGKDYFVVVQFYVISGLVACVAGLFMSLILMLQSTLTDLVAVLGLGVAAHPLVNRNQESSNSEESREHDGESRDAKESPD